ncbi:MAG: alpha/beta hydrolase family protein [Parvularculaceae bacterium]
MKARSVRFVSDDFVVVTASDTKRLWYTDKFEYSGAYAYDIKKNKLRSLLRGTDELFPAQSGLGRIVGRVDGEPRVFMPAFIGPISSPPNYNLLSVSLRTGHGRVVARGRNDTADWIVSPDGTILAREDAMQRDGIYRIYSEIGGKRRMVYEQKNVTEPPFALMGVTPQEDALVVVDYRRDADFRAVYRLSVDGAPRQRIFARDDRGLRSLIIDDNRQVLGVRYAGMRPSYEFLDPKLTDAMATIVAWAPGGAVEFVDATDDYGRILVRVSGEGRAPAYYVYRHDALSVERIVSVYEDIPDAAVGMTLSVEYPARDGLKIPTVATFPPGEEPGARPLPMIVMPHGGPEAYDDIGFDWLAQYFANRGFLVLQPNFRGSEGFGARLNAAGEGEWGGKMQDDVTDGRDVFVRNGWADGSRVCIVGASYGGYAALAGGAFTPDKYRCVAAIAPVTDVPEVFDEIENRRGRRNWVMNYLTRTIGDRKSDKDHLEAISPVNAANAFVAPVLLLHGVDDTVVPFGHSRRMERALRKAGKDVRLVKLKNEDHWLSSAETRIQTLRELDRFVSAHIGAN